MFLTHNAEKLMDLNRTQACQMNCCGPCQGQKDVKSCMSGAAWGNTPDLCDKFKNSYVTNPYNCCVPRKDMENYYPHGASVAVNRLTVPSGGVALSGGDPHLMS